MISLTKDLVRNSTNVLYNNMIRTDRSYNGVPYNTLNLAVVETPMPTADEWKALGISGKADIINTSPAVIKSPDNPSLYSIQHTGTKSVITIHLDLLDRQMVNQVTQAQWALLFLGVTDKNVTDTNLLSFYYTCSVAFSLSDTPTNTNIIMRGGLSMDVNGELGSENIVLTFNYNFQ